MAHGNEAETRRLYERYKLQWMLYHELDLTDLIDCMEVMIHEDLASSETRAKLQDLFKAWEFGVGFLNGQIWPCFEEYRASELASDPGKAHLLIPCLNGIFRRRYIPRWRRPEQLCWKS